MFIGLSISQRFSRSYLRKYSETKGIKTLRYEFRLSCISLLFAVVISCIRREQSDGNVE